MCIVVCVCVRGSLCAVVCVFVSQCSICCIVICWSQCLSRSAVCVCVSLFMCVECLCVLLYGCVSVCRCVSLWVCRSVGCDAVCRSVCRSVGVAELPICVAEWGSVTHYWCQYLCKVNLLVSHGDPRCKPEDKQQPPRALGTLDTAETADYTWVVTMGELPSELARL